MATDREHWQPEALGYPTHFLIEQPTHFLIVGLVEESTLEMEYLQTKTISRRTVPDDGSSNRATYKSQPKERATESSMEGKVTASATAHIDAVPESGGYEADDEWMEENQLRFGNVMATETPLKGGSVTARMKKKTNSGRVGKKPVKLDSNNVFHKDAVMLEMYKDRIANGVVTNTERSEKSVKLGSGRVFHEDTVMLEMYEDRIANGVVTNTERSEKPVELDSNEVFHDDTAGLEMFEDCIANGVVTYTEKSEKEMAYQAEVAMEAVNKKWTKDMATEKQAWESAVKVRVCHKCQVQFHRKTVCDTKFVVVDVAKKMNETMFIEKSSEETGDKVQVYRKDYKEVRVYRKDLVQFKKDYMEEMAYHTKVAVEVVAKKLIMKVTEIPMEGKVGASKEVATEFNKTQVYRENHKVVRKDHAMFAMRKVHEKVKNYKKVYQLDCSKKEVYMKVEARVVQFANSDPTMETKDTIKTEGNYSE